MLRALAGFERKCAGDIVGAGFERIRETVQHFAALDGGQATPLFLRGRRAAHGEIGIMRTRAFDGSDDIAIRRIDHFEESCACGRLERVVDEILIVAHACLHVCVYRRGRMLWSDYKSPFFCGQ